MKAKTIIEINSRGNLQREMEIKRDSYLEQILDLLCLSVGSLTQFRFIGLIEY